MAWTTLRCYLALSCVLCLPASLSAKPINHAKHLAIAGGNVTNVMAPVGGPGPFSPKLRPLFKREVSTFVKRDGTWTVQAGDTGNGIAARLGISFIQLAFLNPNVQWHNLQIGQVLNIPCADGTTGSRPYVVAAGDTGNAIAAANEITFDALNAYNPGVVWTNLQIGQTLIIPNPSMGESQAVDVQDSQSIQAVGSIPATIAVSNFDNGMSHSVTCTAQAGSNTPAVIDISKGAPKVVQENSPFLTPGLSRRTPEHEAQFERLPIKVRLVRTDQGAQSDLNSNMVLPRQPVPSSSSFSTYVVKSGDTGYAIAIAQGIPLDDLFKANPGVVWTNLQIGQVLVLPKSARVSILPIPSVPAQSSPAPVRKSGQDVYTLYSGSASIPPYPLMSAWLNFSSLWASNLPKIGTHCDFFSGSVPPNTQKETNSLRTAITAVANDTGVNPAFVLAVVLQESNGCVRVPTTSSWQGTRNPGLLQSFNGAATCNNGSGTLQPCTDTVIYTMISEGVKGVKNVGIVPALQQAAKMNGIAWPMTRNMKLTSQKRDELPCPEPEVGVPAHSVLDEATLYYQAARIYNSGSVPTNGDLSGATGSTRCYVSDIVNRLMGWVTASSTCWL